MPAVSPSGVGCTSVAYSIGYNSRCDSTAFRTSSLSSTVTVLIQVIPWSFFLLNAYRETEVCKPAVLTRRHRRQETPVSGCWQQVRRATRQALPETRSALMDKVASDSEWRLCVHDET